MSTSPKNPIFIIGPARSDTTIITQAMRACAHIEGFHEGHFLPLMHDLVSRVDSYFYTKRKLIENELHMIAHVDKDHLKRLIIDNFKTIYEEICPQKVWLDKSPDSVMVRGADELRIAWPHAKFIFAKRRGIENICSRLRKFPHVDFEAHCNIWANTMQSWLDVRDRLGEQAIEIEQREIALNPLESAETLASFLGLNAEQAAQMGEVFSKKRPQKTSQLETRKAITIEETGWTQSQIELFQNICGEVSSAMGYSVTSLYKQ